MSAFIEDGELGVFILVTLAFGGWISWMTGRAIAHTWAPLWQVVPAAIPLALAIRFIHYALFRGTLLSARYLLVDFAVALAVAALAFRFTRTGQMTRQYRWLYRRTGPLTWQERAPGS